jgi:MFS family permease
MKPRETPGYVGLLVQNADFRRLWLGQVVSFFGDWFKMIALYTMVQEITDSTLAISGVMVGAMLPVFLVIPIAGPIVDRFDRRKVMLVTDVARSVLALGLLAAHWLESLTLLYGVLSAMVAFSGVFIPARTAIIPQVTSKEELPVAMALSGGTWSVMLAPRWASTVRC